VKLTASSDKTSLPWLRGIRECQAIDKCIWWSGPQFQGHMGYFRYSEASCCDHLCFDQFSCL